MNTFSKTRIEFHILQSFPVTCLNRDDLGSPKSAIVGGVSRARVSSQCWKRQVRMAMQDFGIKLAVRTKHVASLIKDACIAKSAPDDKAETVANLISETLAKDTLLFISQGEIDAFAEYASEHSFDLSEIKEKALVKDLAKVAKQHKVSAADGLDIALFGRMVAKASEMNVEAASSFSHAISTHKVSSDVEFFTALDDYKDEDEDGSSHMGSLEYNSATYYRYICLDLGQLAETIGSEDADSMKADLQRAVEAFVKALYVAVPSARQTTQAGYCGWDYARVLVRKGQPLQFSCEKPVRADMSGGYLEPSCVALNKFLDEKERMSGTLYGKISEYTLSKDVGSIDELVSTLQTVIADYE